ncbi:MAG: JAB domain-containing protein [Firmicutes bacterium]|nr:JAB domain-containing protein [Bacillota bacterium]
MKLQEIPISERPREKLLLDGVASLSNEELLAILMNTGTSGRNVKEIALDIIRMSGGIENFKNLTLEQLLKIDGVGVVKASKILSTIELGKRIFLKNSYVSRVKIKSSKDIYDEMKYVFYNQKQEFFYCLYLNNKNEIIERKLLFMGTINRSLVHPREIFKHAYLASASSIVCVHNHPSGDTKPSREDIRLTESLIELGELNAIPVIDHVIIGDDDYYSFCDQGMLIH